MGGLGNQLFQYATARSIALKHGTGLRFDCSFFCSSSRPPLLFNRFDVAGNFASAEDENWLNEPFVWPRWRKLLFRATQSTGLGGRPHYILDKPGKFLPSLMSAPSSVYLVGYW